MKKAIKTVAVMAVAVALLLTLTACGDDLEGVWSAFVYGDELQITFCSNHTFIVTYSDGDTVSKDDFYWSESGNAVILNDGKETLVLVHEGNKLTGKIQGESVTFKKK